MSDIFNLGPDTDFEQEWKNAKAYLKKYVEMVGWWRLLPDSDKYRVLLEDMRLSEGRSYNFSILDWKDLPLHVKILLMDHYDKQVRPGGSCPRCRPGGASVDRRDLEMIIDRLGNVWEVYELDDSDDKIIQDCISVLEGLLEEGKLK